MVFKQKLKFYLNFDLSLTNLYPFNKSPISKIKEYLQFQIHQLSKKEKIPGLTFKNQRDSIAELGLRFPVFHSFIWVLVYCFKLQKNRNKNHTQPHKENQKPQATTQAFCREKKKKSLLSSNSLKIHLPWFHFQPSPVAPSASVTPKHFFHCL